MIAASSRNAEYWQTATDFEIEAAASEYFGKPVNRHLSNKRELRFGTHGSKSVALFPEKRGAFFDHDPNDAAGRNGRQKGYLPRPREGETRSTDWFACVDLAEVEDFGEATSAGRNSDRTAFARFAWSQGSSLTGTPGQTYLVRRGILSDDDLREVLRFGTYKGRGMLLVAARTWKGPIEKGQFVAIQRIYLKQDGSKDNGSDGAAKKMLGSLTSDDGKPAFVIMRGSSEVYVHEGVEDALATRRAFVETGHEPPTVVATLGIGRFANAAAVFTGAVFVADNDKLAETEKAARDACGRIVTFTAFDGCNDANEVLLAHGPQALADALLKVEMPSPEGESTEETKPGPTALVPFSKFVASLQPPDYLVDNILQRGWLYSLTAKTGSGKTAVALDLAVRVAEGKPLGALETSKGQVVYLSGENPEDVKARCLMLAKHHGVTDPAIFFLEGANDLEKNIDWLIRQIEAVSGASLIIVDTSAAYFGGDDDNSNVELGAYARLFRRFCKMDCRPCVVVLAHPTKNPSKENLVPRGGGAFLNEVDGNLTLWTEDKEITSLHWQGKFRGPDFEPIQFRLKIIKDEQYLDSKGRLLPSVIALPIDAVQAETIEEETHKQEDRVLLSFDDNPDLSIRERARLLGFVADNGQPLKGRVERILAQLVEGKLLTRNRRKQYRLTEAGQREVAALRGYRKGKKETENAGQ